MRRRDFVFAAGALSLSGCRLWPDQGVWNPCLGAELPEHLAEHELVRSSLDGLEASQLWDGHVHLIGSGDSGSGLWVNPHMRSLLHPVQFAQFRFYLNAGCADPDQIDTSYVHQLQALHKQLPQGARLLLLAFDYTYDEQGQQRPGPSAFHTPNDYAADVAQRHPDQFEWIASIHPYREDCVEILNEAAAAGARAVKWLPPAMGIKPDSALCDRFYEAMRKHDMPLLVHAGEEKAVHGANEHSFGNPLLLRRPLERGVRVIVAHCASLGNSEDLDNNNKAVTNFALFTRLMEEKAFEDLLFGEISAMTQANRLGTPLETIISREDWQHRLINGSDYPLPAVMPLFSMNKMVKHGYIDSKQAAVLSDIRRHNALLFDLVLKRQMQFNGRRLRDIVFASKRVFMPGS